MIHVVIRMTVKMRKLPAPHRWVVDLLFVAAGLAVILGAVRLPC